MDNETYISPGMIKIYRFVDENPNCTITMISKKCDLTYCHTHNMASILIRKGFLNRSKKGRLVFLNVKKSNDALKDAAWKSTLNRIQKG